ncbi:hypothetical protein ACPUEJ_16595 [Vibrio tubiashii]|uniref:hypothetical protein n=1 Tax=Vibrio tubiashii TaxID=29498 RepID=UPI003CE596D2
MLLPSLVYIVFALTNRPFCWLAGQIDLLVKSGLGWGRLATHETEHEPGLISVPTFEPLNVPIYIARKKTTALGPVGQLVWDYFQATFHELNED